MLHSNQGALQYGFEYIPSAIPIPQSKQLNSNQNNHCSNYPKTPSLKSILDQKSRSTGSIKSNDSSNSIPSLISSSESFESCDDSHPLDYFNNTWEDIDENFFSNDNNNNSIDDNKFEPLQPISPMKRPVVSKKASFVSNLSSSIKNFTQSTVQNNNNLLFDIQPRLTDDKLPKTTLVTNPKQLNNVTELKTFKMTSEPDNFQSWNSRNRHNNSSSQISIIKQRESRINPQFLRLYSYESSSRQKGLLPEISSQDEENYLHSQNKLLFHHQKRDPKRDFALMVRQRLWQCVVLPPRDDLNIHPPEYVYIGDDQQLTDDNSSDEEEEESISLIQKNQDIKPWITLEDEKSEKRKFLKPCGFLSNDVQFTVKGWCNERWMPKN